MVVDGAGENGGERKLRKRTANETFLGSQFASLYGSVQLEQSATAMPAQADAPQ